MYIKTVKKSGKKYKYYYHNVKVEGRVKNIFTINKGLHDYRNIYIQLNMYIYTTRGDINLTKK